MKLAEKVKENSECIGIYGLGYVGIPLARRISETGTKVIGFDIDESRVSALNSSSSPIEHISDEEITGMIEAGFEATLDFSRTTECDALIICVPTPLDEYRQPDLSYVESTMDQIAPYLREEHLVSLESTTWPGTTEEVLAPYFDRAGLKIGENCYLVYSPEREDPGNPNFETQTIPKVLGADSNTCRDNGVAIYSKFIDEVVPVSSAKTAEMVKLLENIHRSVNIGLVNEMKIVADRMGLDIFEIIDAAKSKPFGFTAYYPGPGIGGHCIPIDPFYLTWKAREYGLHTRFIELAGEINASMPEYVVGKISLALNNVEKSLKGAKVLVLGIAYKSDLDDVRESPAVDVMEILSNHGAEVAYSDPHVPVFPPLRGHTYFDLSSVELTPESLASFDLVVLTTHHSKFDTELICAHAPILVDTRGIYRNKPNVVRA